MPLTQFAALLVGIVLFGTILGFYTKKDSLFGIICGILFIFTPLFWLSVTMIGGRRLAVNIARFNQAFEYVSNQWISDLGFWVLGGVVLTLSIQGMQYGRKADVDEIEE